MSNAEFLPHVIKFANEGHSVTIPLKGFSMRPFLEDQRDKAILVSIDRELKVGDVVLAEVMKDKYVLHRIIDIEGDTVQLLGDGNLMPDPKITKGDVKAIAKAFLRKGTKHEDSVDGLYFKVYSFVWMRLFPVRRWLLALWRRIPLTVRNHLI